MRTTLTLDDDVAAKIDAEVRRTGTSFKAVVNHALRTGLLQRTKLQERTAFKVRSTPLGLRPGLSYENVEELLDAVEGPLRT